MTAARDAALWAASGALALTGDAGGPPCLPLAPLALAVDDAIGRLRARVRDADALAGIDVRVLGERAAAAGATRQGRTNPGGHTRLLELADGWIALSLARGDDDLALLPALLASDEPAPADREGAFAWLAARLRERSVTPLVAQARTLGLACAAAAREIGVAAPRIDRLASPAAPDGRFRVLDCSALWAGPLAADLLRRAGAEVAKLESSARPDGARFGPAAFFDRMHAGKAMVAFDWREARARDRLRALVDAVDVVIEASRPRAFAQLGIDAEAWVAERPGRIWCSITGYGRRGEAGHWVAFGDDAAVAAGLAWRVAGAPRFVGDAIADPLTGVEAARCVLEARAQGGGALISLSLRDVVASAMRHPGGSGEAGARVATDGRSLRIGDQTVAIEAPVLLPFQGRARPLGADTVAIEREWVGRRSSAA